MPNVSVACKLPHGLILELPNAEPVRLNGANHPEAIAGFGITAVDKDFFEAWKTAHKDFAPLVKGLIFAQDRADSIRAEAKDKAALKTGLEGLDPEAPAPGIQAENYEGRKKKTAE